MDTNSIVIQYYPLQLLYMTIANTYLSQNQISPVL